MRPGASIPALLVVVGVLTAGVVAGDAHYDVTVDSHVDTPPREVEHRGQTFEIDSLGCVEPGDAMDVRVSGPTDSSYAVDLKDADGRTMNSKRGTGDDALTFATDGFEPGTYLLVLYDSDGYQAVEPLVVSGYGVSIDGVTASEAGAGTEVTVEASLTAVDGAKAFDRVQAVLGNTDVRRAVELSADGDGEYSATFAVDALPEGDYSLYVVVRGSRQVLGNEEILGVSGSRSLTIGTATGGSVASGGSSGCGATTGGTPSTTRTAARTSTDDAVITPNDPSPTRTTAPGQPLGVLPVLVVVLVVAVHVRRRR